YSPESLPSLGPWSHGGARLGFGPIVRGLADLPWRSCDPAQGHAARAGALERRYRAAGPFRAGAAMVDRAWNRRAVGALRFVCGFSTLNPFSCSPPRWR